jgi:hypothetical protein
VYVNCGPDDEVCPSTVTLTVTAPEPGGVTAVQLVGEEQDTSVAGVDPKSNTGGPLIDPPVRAPADRIPGSTGWNPVPVMVTEVPPAAGPDDGLTPVTVGVGR